MGHIPFLLLLLLLLLFSSSSFSFFQPFINIKTILKYQGLTKIGWGLDVTAGHSLLTPILKFQPTVSTGLVSQNLSISTPSNLTQGPSYFSLQLLLHVLTWFCTLTASHQISFPLTAQLKQKASSLNQTGGDLVQKNDCFMERCVESYIRADQGSRYPNLLSKWFWALLRHLLTVILPK